MSATRCAVQVLAGVTPDVPKDEVCKMWVIASDEWGAADVVEQETLLTDLAFRANAYAMMLMLQPDQFNWVKTEWVWY